MKTNTKTSGFSAVEIVLVLAVMGLIGYLGYMFYNNYQASTKPAETSTVTPKASSKNDVPPAPEVKSTTDLDAAESALDSADPSAMDEGDSSDLDSQSAYF